MAVYTYEAFYLGTFADLDPNEGNNNTNSENAAALSGRTFGTVTDELRNHIVSVSMNDANNDGTFKDDRNAENLTYNLGSGNVTRALDSAQTYTATITYPSYTGLPPATVTAVIIQDSAGNLFWIPPPTTGAGATAMTAGPIQSVSIGAVVGSDFTGVSVPRPNLDLLCFAAGTLIATRAGAVAVEGLRPGDAVFTLDSGYRRLAWTGARRVAALGRHAPVEIAAGTFGNDRPLVVSPQHRILVTGWRAELLFGERELLVPAVALVDGDRVRRREGGFVTYHHLMFDRHEIVLAEDVPCESLFLSADSLAALDPAARAELLDLFPELAHASAVFGLSARQCVPARMAAALA